MACRSNIAYVDGYWSTITTNLSKKIHKSLRCHAGFTFISQNDLRNRNRHVGTMDIQPGLCFMLLQSAQSYRILKTVSHTNFMMRLNGSLPGHGSRCRYYPIHDYIPTRRKVILGDLIFWWSGVWCYSTKQYRLVAPKLENALFN